MAILPWRGDKVREFLTSPPVSPSPPRRGGGEVLRGLRPFKLPLMVTSEEVGKKG